MNAAFCHTYQIYLQMSISAVQTMPITSITARPVLLGFLTWTGTTNSAPFTSRSRVYAMGNAPAKSPRKQNNNGTVSADEVIGTPR